MFFSRVLRRAAPLVLPLAGAVVVLRDRENFDLPLALSRLSLAAPVQVALAAPAPPSRQARFTALFDGGDFSTLKAELEAELGKQRTPELLWQLARANHKLREATCAADKVKGKAMAAEAHALALEALSLNDKLSPAYKWAGITLNAVGEYEGSKIKISNAFKVRDFWEKAAQLDPKDATTRYLLGAWCYNITEISWVERQAAAVLFATPPTSTYEQALAHFLEAERIEPGFYSSNTLHIAKVYDRLKLKDDAVAWAKRAAAFQPKNDEDKANIKAAQDLLKKLGVA